MGLSYCQCGCGGEVGLATKTNTKAGLRKGEPVRYLLGHQQRKGPDYIEEDRGHDTPCWVWQRHIHTITGYGMTRRDGGGSAHAWYYRKHVGEVPPGLQLDHRCRVRVCVNPEHLEPVTAAENQRRRTDLKLNTQKAKEIRQLVKGGWRQHDIAEAYGVNQSVVSDIKRGALWAS